MLRRGIALLLVLLAVDTAAARDIKTPTPTNTSGTMQVATQGSDAERSACTPDVFRLCGQYIPDVDGIFGCLKVQRANLSPACRAVIH